TMLPSGPYPYAGVPWFNAPFGRDGIITALECLWLEPSLARGVLAYLASTQATDVIPAQDAEPRQILHEAREKWRRSGRCHSPVTTAVWTQRRFSSTWRVGTTSAPEIANLLKASGRTSKPLCVGCIDTVTVTETG